MMNAPIITPPNLRLILLGLRGSSRYCVCPSSVRPGQGAWIHCEGCGARLHDTCYFAQVVSPGERERSAQLEPERRLWLCPGCRS